MNIFNYTNSWQCEHGGRASHKLCEHWCRASLYSGHNYTRLFVEHSYQISLVLGCPGLSWAVPPLMLMLMTGDVEDHLAM